MQSITLAYLQAQAENGNVSHINEAHLAHIFMQSVAILPVNGEVYLSL
jgi:hypothetical protein